MATPQYVFHMDGLTKAYAGGKKVFENIRLSFLPGVKIGVVGVNGSGKSSLLRIMAGQDKDFQGEAWAAKGVTVGYLPQEPELDPALYVRGNVMEGVAAKRALLERYNEVAMKVAEDYSDELMEEMTTLQDQIDAQNLWDLDSQVDVAMEALRCPPDDATVDTLSGGEKRRVALCKLLLENPDILLLDEPTNHLDAETIAWLQKHLIEYRGTILIVTHDRYFLDDITGWILELDRGRGIPWEGNYSSWLEQKAKRLAPGGPRGQGPPADPDPRARMDPPGRQGPPGQAEGPHQRLQRARLQVRAREDRHRPDRHPERPPPRPERHRRREPRKALRRPRADRRPDLRPPPRRHRRRHRPERRRQDHALPHADRPGGSPTPAPSPTARSSSSPTSTSPATPSTRRRPSGRKSPTASTWSSSATPR